ncbi:MAG: hypothetical protein OXJ52_05610, partial [Oligoflexia bacterium]|nr:hypothetical protein [Oligoflexia bacterium]
GTDTNLQQIKVQGGGMALDLVAEKSQLKTKYGMEGLVDFQLKCEEAGGVSACKKCAGPFPCPPVKWSLSLISQTKVNNIPSFNRVLKQSLTLTHTGPNDSDFVCGFLASQPQLACEDRKGTIEGWDSHGNKKCFYLCPKGKTRKDGSGCDCPTGYAWTGTQCAETCKTFPGASYRNGLKVNGQCFDTTSIATVGIFSPSLKMFISPNSIPEPYVHGEHSVYRLFRRMKHLLNTVNTVTGFDENGNMESFNICPSGKVWIGSKCVEYCNDAMQYYREDGTSSFFIHTGKASGIKINGLCHYMCFKDGSINEPICRFMRNLGLWILDTKNIRDTLPGGLIGLSRYLRTIQ